MTGEDDGDDESTDLNERVEADWVEETTPDERVRTVMRRMYEPESVNKIADRANTSLETAREQLRRLAGEGFIVESDDNERGCTRYRRSNQSLLIEQANQIREEYDIDSLASAIVEMEETIRKYQEEFNADSPEDAELSDADIDKDTLQEWQTTCRNLAFAYVALALSEEETENMDIEGHIESTRPPPLDWPSLWKLFRRWRRR